MGKEEEVIAIYRKLGREVHDGSDGGVILSGLLVLSVVLKEINESIQELTKQVDISLMDVGNASLIDCFASNNYQASP